MIRVTPVTPKAISFLREPFKFSEMTVVGTWTNSYTRLYMVAFTS